MRFLGLGVFLLSAASRCAALSAIGPRPGWQRQTAPAPRRSCVASVALVEQIIIDEAVAGVAAATKRSGHPHTAQSKAKISAANKGKTPWNLGRRHSEETRRRIAEGTKKACAAKAEALQRERARTWQLRLEEPEAYAKLVAQEAAKAVARATAAQVQSERNAHLKKQKRQAAARARAEQRGSEPGVRRVRTGNGRVNFTLSEESKAKISASIRAKWRDPAYRAARSNATVSAETRAAISKVSRP